MLRWHRGLPAVSLIAWLLPAPVAGELALPPGFTSQVYVTGGGFDQGSWRGAPLRGRS